MLELFLTIISVVLAVCSTIADITAIVFIIKNKDEFKIFALSDMTGSLISALLIAIKISLDQKSDSSYKCSGELLIYSIFVVSLMTSSAGLLCEALFHQQRALITMRESVRSLTSIGWRQILRKAMMIASVCGGGVAIIIIYVNMQVKPGKTPCIEGRSYENLIGDLYNYNSETSDWQADGNEIIMIGLVKSILNGNISHEQLLSLNEIRDNLEQIGHNSVAENNVKTYNFLTTKLGIPNESLENIFSADTITIEKDISDIKRKKEIEKPVLPHNSSLLYELLRKGPEEFDLLGLNRPTEESTTLETLTFDDVTIQTVDNIGNNSEEIQDDTNDLGKEDPIKSPKKECAEDKCEITENFLYNFNIVMLLVFLLQMVISAVFLFQALVILYEDGSEQNDKQKLINMTKKEIIVHILYITFWLPLLIERIINISVVTELLLYLLLLAYSNNLCRATYYIYDSLMSKASRIGIENTSEASVVRIQRRDLEHESNC